MLANRIHVNPVMYSLRTTAVFGCVSRVFSFLGWVREAKRKTSGSHVRHINEVCERNIERLLMQKGDVALRLQRFP